MTPRLTIHTVAVRDDGAFSALLWDGRPFAVSVERTFAPGEARHGKDIVIRNGTYLCRRSYYYRGDYPTFEIEVTGHDRVLFHKGNLETHSEACVIVAESFGVLNGSTAVLNSSAGFGEFMELTRGLSDFYMEVVGR